MIHVRGLLVLTVGNEWATVNSRMSDTSTGERLAAIRKKLGYSTRHVAKLSEGAVSHGQVGKLENGVQSLDVTSWGVIKGLARAYHLTPEELLEQVQGPGTLAPISHITRTINVYKLQDARVRGERDIVTHTEIDASLSGKFEAYLITEPYLAGLIPTPCIAKVRLQDAAEPNDLIICYHSTLGVVLRRFISTRAGTTQLATGTTVTSLQDVDIIGKVISYEVWLEPFPQS